jgi:hypothetical protein
MPSGGTILVADAQHARLDAAEEAFKATVAQPALAFEETCSVRPP